jgi:predicted MFS family arabinose efflux permease
LEPAIVGAAMPSEDIAVWRAVFAGLCASLVGVGLARFAYTPLLPALIAAHWFSPSAAVYLAAANLAGYLGGALLARPIAARIGTAAALRLMMIAATAAFFGCAAPLSFAWYFTCRFAAGISGGALMALAAPAVLKQVPPARRGLAGGVIFTGVGLGIAASGTLVPLLMRAGLVTAWLGLGAVSLGLTLLSWNAWPGRPPTGAAARGREPHPGLNALYIVYGLNAVGLVPHMILLVDFVARGLGRGLAAGAQCWVLFGIGAMAGPLVAGRLGDRISFGAAMRLALLVQAVAVGMLAVSAGPASLALSSIVVGAFVPGVVPLALGRVHELVPHNAELQRRAWVWCTIAFALGQAVAAYGFSALFARTAGSYPLLFAVGATALLLALAIDLAAATRRRRAICG